MVDRPLTLLHYYSPALMLHTMHAPELLSFVGLFQHQHELSGDSVQIEVAKLAASGSHASLADYSPNALAYLLAHTRFASTGPSIDAELRGQLHP